MIILDGANTEKTHLTILIAAYSYGFELEMENVSIILRKWCGYNGISE